MASWSRQAVELLIIEYQENKCLYEIGSPEYHNKEKRNAAPREIAACLADVQPGTSQEDIKSKINGLRTQFMAERNKLRKGKKSGALTDDIPKPTLWCYNSLLFLEKHSMPRQSISNLEVANENGSTSSCESPVMSAFDNGSCVVAGKMSSPSAGPDKSFTASDAVDTPTTGSARKGRKRVQEPDMSQFLERASSALDEAKRRHTSSEHFGLFIGMELDKLKNPVVRKKAICNISTILLEAFVEDQD